MRGIVTVFFIVIAVVGMVVLVRFAEPRLKRKHEEQLKALCQSRLIRLSEALQLYLDRYDNLLPPAPTWCDALEGFIPPSQRQFAFHCSKLETPKGYGFAMNSYAWDKIHNSPLWLPQMYPQDKVVLVYETNKTKRNSIGTGNDIPNLGRHNGENLFLFADGSIISLTPQEVKEMKERGELLFKPLPLPPTSSLPRR